jgi:hypothetical protein
MALDAERLEILRLVETRQISPEEGARLLTALDRDAAPPRPPAPATPAGAGRWFKLLVEEPGGQRVNLTFPLTAVPTVLRVAARLVSPEQRDVLESAATTVASGFRGDLVNVEEPGGQRVRLWIE